MKPQPPKHSITIRSYQELEQYSRAFGAGYLNLLVLVGAPGLEKSHMVRQAVGSDVCWIEGHATALGLYSELWEHSNRPVVIDDVDGLYADPKALRLLKCLCQSDPVKRLAWHSHAATLVRAGIPRSFRTTSRVAIIANDWRTLNSNVAAVEDRGHVISFEPSPLEVHRRTARWFWDQEIFDFFAQRLALIRQASMRPYVQAWELKRAGLDWRRLVLARWLSGPALLVAQLKADRSFQSEEARVQAFRACGGGCRATYFNHARNLEPRCEAPSIVLQNDPPHEPRASEKLFEFIKRRHRRLGND